MKPNQQRGVALVITLIMLSVITFLAVAFLALTRRDKASVNVSLTQTDSRFMADTALARAEAEIVSRMIATTNLLNYDLMLTKNYVNTNGYEPNSTNFLDVNYDVTTTGSPLTPNQLMQNVANLYFDPRPPVYIKTNEVGPLDFRFYIDFNRNGRFDSNGLQFVLADDGEPVNTTNTVLTWGDPEWIGVLEKPQYPHSATNRFVGRYAFMALPEGKTLDVNFMHNAVKGPDNMPLQDGFLRNQGVGSWELNLAAFLEDLNTNLYLYVFPSPYNYQTNFNNLNLGGSFDDAFNILKYRYRAQRDNPTSARRSTLLSAQELFPFNYQSFRTDNIDEYGDGPLLQGHLALRNESAGLSIDPTDEPWAGSKNTNAYRSVGELLEVNKTSSMFVQRMNTVLARSNSHDNQTFTRLLSQLGTTSDTNNTYITAWGTFPKIHLNYDNVHANTDGFISQTNFFEWEPLAFFTNAAQALIRQTLILGDATNDYIGGLGVGKKFGLTNIMVYPTNQYTPTVHRLLQLAANIYSASTNGFQDSSISNSPVVFRPQFKVDGTNVSIVNYVEVKLDGLTQFEKGFKDPRTDLSAIAADPNVNVVGVPWVVSAKKGLPNFNEFSFETAFQITRKMELVKDIPKGLSPALWWKVKPNETNLMYVVGITNYIGVEFWNSYTSAYTADITLRFTNNFRATLTNHLGLHLTNEMPDRLKRFGMNWTPASIPGTIDKGELNTNSFIVDHRSLFLLPTSAYFPPDVNFRPASNALFEKTARLVDPDWDILLTNQVAAIIWHQDSQRVLDFVNLGDTVTHIDISKELIGPEVNPPNEPNLGHALWHTNRLRNATDGMMNQIEISKGNITAANLWKNHSPKTEGDIEAQIDAFRVFVGESPKYGNVNITPTNRIQVPFSPTRMVYVQSSFQANDPLVHYMANDLVEPGITSKSVAIVPANKSYYEFTENNLKQINNRYSPWGGKRTPGATEGEGDFKFEPAVKDPLVRWSDDWDFPTNKFPNVGWLGRVHRGSPWQTMYLKATVAKDSDWKKWSGSNHTHPTNDWRLLEVFTAAPNDNAARGLLSVNQGGLASWSAVLSGVVVLTNSSSIAQVDAIKYPVFDPYVVEPSSPQLNAIVAGINQARANRPNGVFTSVGDVLAAPELSSSSPFLNQSHVKHVNFGLNDAAYERIPQQVLSLLKVGHPRYAIYSYGQALRPAQNSIVISPPAGSRHLQNLCTNYQIAGEVVTKTVLRVEGTPQSPKAVVESFEILSEN